MTNSMKKAAFERAKVRKPAADLYNSSARDRVARAKAEMLLGPRPKSPYNDNLAETMMSSTAHKYYDNDDQSAEERERSASRKKQLR